MDTIQVNTLVEPVVPRSGRTCRIATDLVQPYFGPSHSRWENVVFFPASRHDLVAEPLQIEQLGRVELQTHRNRLLRSALAMCRNRAEAEDLVQETFLNALQSSRFRGDSSIHTWLHGILMNLCHKHVRDGKKLILDEELVTTLTIEPIATPAQDAVCCARSVTEGVLRLSPKHREVIVLRYYRNLKIWEIARQTGVCKGTVRSRLHYAVLELEKFVPNKLNPFSSESTHHQTSY